MVGIRCTKRYGPPRWVFKVQSFILAASLYYVHVSDVTLYSVRSAMVLQGRFSKFNLSYWPSLYYVRVSDVT